MVVTDATTIVVESPFDLVGSVLVPGLAILVSTLIAVGLARHERRAADRMRMGNQIEQFALALSELATAAESKDRHEVYTAARALYGTGNVILLSLPKRDRVVLDFIISAIAIPMRSRDLAVLRKATEWGADALEAWRLGSLRTRDFAAAFPKGVPSSVRPTPDLSEWNKHTQP